jgi:phosphoglycolate phosphatase
MNYALEQLGEPTHSTEVCRTFIGNGVAMFAKRALRPDKQDLCSDLLRQTKQRYRDKCFDCSTLYDGIKDAVKDLQGQEIRLAVATNKDQDVARIIVEHYFGDAFEYIIGIDGKRPVKPDTAGTVEILNGMGLTPEEVLFVGDSDVDMNTAANAGIKSVGVSWGFRSKNDLLAAGADIIIENPSEIIGLTA